jgi:hypothetical protein
MPPLCRFGNANIMLHDVWTNPQGTVAYLAYWDAGFILLDISDSSQPRYLGRGTYDLSDDGNTHSVVPAQGGNLVIVGDEVDKQETHGFMRVFDTTDVRDPVEIGRFHTENNREPPPDDKSYSIHNLFVRGATVYAAWKSDGIRLLDISAPAAPREIGFFVPPAVADPNGNFPQNSVWGVYVQRDLIFASFQTGLYILKQRRMRIGPGDADSRVQLGNGQRAAVAILGSERFDVTQLDVQSLAFGPHGARPIAEARTSDQSPNVEDVNGDGFEDLLVQFEVTETGISLGDVEACLMGETFAGVPFSECDAMEVVEPSGGRRRR